jgi:hypothetical protein
MIVTVCVRDDGSIEYLHNEDLGLDSHGPQQVRRASHVEFEPGTVGGVWYVEDARTGERLFSHPSRAECLRWEADYYNAQLASGLRPFE